MPQDTHTHTLSVSRTVLWGQWRKIRWILLTILIGIVLAHALLLFLDSRGLRPNAGARSEDFLIALLLIAVPAIVTAASVLLLHSDAEEIQIGLPLRILRLPLATWKLVALLMGFGILASTLITLAATLPALHFLNVNFHWSLPLLTAAFAMPLIQLWAFTFGAASPRIAALSFITCFAIFSQIAQNPTLVKLATQAHPLIALLVLGLQLAIVYILAVWITTLNRNGAWRDKLSSFTSAITTPKNKKPFTSKPAAQFWYEWKLFGWLLPLYTTAIAAAYFLGLPLIVGLMRLSNTTGQSSQEPLFAISWLSSAQFVTTGLILSAVIGASIVGGIMFMKAGHWNATSKYILTRPLSTCRIANARINTILISALSTFTILAGILLLIRAAAIQFGDDHLGLMFYLQVGYESIPAAVPLLIFWAGILFILWMGAWSINVVWALTIFALTHLPSLALIWLLAATGFITFSEAQLLSYAALSICNYAAAAILIIGLLYMAYHTTRNKLTFPAYTWLAAALWLTYSLTFILYVQSFSVPADAKEWVFRFPHPVDWSLWIGLSALPITPLFLHPILLERARIN